MICTKKIERFKGNVSKYLKPEISLAIMSAFQLHVQKKDTYQRSAEQWSIIRYHTLQFNSLAL